MRTKTGSFAIALLALFACGGAPLHPIPIEDQARRVAPLPACVLQLSPRPETAASDGTMRRLREEEILRLIFANFDTDKHQLPGAAPACTGAKVFEDGAAPNNADGSGSWPWMLHDDDIVYGSAPGRVKIVWVPIAKAADGTQSGPLALVRGNEKFAELFGVTAFRGKRDRVKLGSARMGTDLLVTIDDDGCSGKKDEGCETKQSLFRARNAQLQHITDVSVSRVGYVASTEKGSSGTLEYRLTSVATFRDDGVHIVEQIRAKDEVGREIRKVELERVLTIDDLGNVKASEPPLWDRIVQGAPREKVTTPTADDHGKATKADAHAPRPPAKKPR